MLQLSWLASAVELENKIICHFSAVNRCRNGKNSDYMLFSAGWYTQDGKANKIVL